MLTFSFDRRRLRIEHQGGVPLSRFLLLTLLLLSISAPQSAVAAGKLPPCPASRKVVWTDCEGAYTYDDWSKYVGVFKDDKRHGRARLFIRMGSNILAAS